MGGGNRSRIKSGMTEEGCGMAVGGCGMTVGGLWDGGRWLRDDHGVAVGCLGLNRVCRVPFRQLSPVFLPSNVTPDLIRDLNLHPPKPSTKKRASWARFFNPKSRTLFCLSSFHRNRNCFSLGDNNQITHFRLLQVFRITCHIFLN